MDLETFIEELRGRFQPFGELSVVTTTNIPGLPEPRIDEVWFVNSSDLGVEAHIINLQEQYPTVVIDVPEHLSLNYSMGTKTEDVIQRSKEQYSNMQKELDGIRLFANTIMDAYKVVIAFNRATMLYNQFQSTRKKSLLQEAYNALKGFKLYSPKILQLWDVIIATGKSYRVKLD